MTSKKHRGFSLLELLIVVAIGFTIAGITVMSMMPMLKKNHVDAAYGTTLSALRNYRNLSITQSRRYIVYFTAPRTITVQYWAYAVPVSPAPVTVATYTLPPDMQFAVNAGYPNPGPDGFGTGSTAINFNACVLVSQPCLIFNPDGTAQDDLGNPDNGVVYISRTGDMDSSRAISVFGSTGRIRGWRLYNQSGYKWVQQ